MNIAVYCAASQSNCPAFDKKDRRIREVDGKKSSHARLWWWKYWTNGSRCDCRDEGRRQSHWRDAAFFL